MEGYDSAPLRAFLCGYHRVQDPSQIDPAQGRPRSFELMARPRPLGVEVGSTVDADNPQPPRVFSFADQSNEPPAQVGERLKVRLPIAEARLLGNPLPPRSQWFCNPGTGEPMEPDLERACVYGVQTRHVWCSLTCQAALRLGFVHSGLDQLYGLDRQQQLYADAGAVRGAYMYVSATPPQGADVQEEAQPRVRNYANSYFTATMALVSERNLMNGIVEVPGPVCKAARLPRFVVPPPSEELLEHLMAERQCTREAVMAEWNAKAAEAGGPTHAYAVPVDHVLAWGLRDPMYAKLHMNGAPVETYRFRPPPNNPAGLDPRVDIILYYLVDNQTFEALLADFRRAWLGRVDVRPLNSLYWDVIPILRQGQTTAEGVLMARSFIHYMLPPKLTPDQEAEIMPALDPAFPSCSAWVPMSQLECAATAGE